MSLINRLSNRLSVLGYSGYEISHIINSATGGRHLDGLSGRELRFVADEMQRYVEAGTEFVASYSK